MKIDTAKAIEIDKTINKLIKFYLGQSIKELQKMKGYNKVWNINNDAFTDYNRDDVVKSVLYTLIKHKKITVI